MRTLPNMTVVVPADERETEAVIDWAASYEALYMYVLVVQV